MIKGRISQNLVSLFSDNQSIQPICEVDLIEWLMSDRYKDQVTQIRQTDNKQIKRHLKAKLPCVTPSGVFSKREKNGLIRHSGLIGIDIDTPVSCKNGNFINLKHIAGRFPYVCFACDSAGGLGSFWLIPINDPNLHSEHYRSISSVLHQHGITVDNACSDVSRLRYATYDPDPYINPNAECYELPRAKSELEFAIPQVQWQASTAGKTTRRVEQLVEAIARSSIDLTDDYRNWYSIGQSLAAEFGERGRSYFHAVSCQSRKYKTERCDIEYDKCLRNCARVGIATFFWHCKTNGLTTTTTHT